MTKEALLLQENAINSIINALNAKNEVTFKAPTGSGKTIMMAKVMDKMLDTDKNLIFFVSSLSKSELAQQNDKVFQEWSKNGKNILHNIDPFIISSDTATTQSGVLIEPNHNVYTIPRDLAKKGGKIMSGPLSSLINNFNINGKKIILIKDECHIAANNIDSIADNHKFFKKLNISATPQTSKFNIDVEITENEAIEAKLIKQYRPICGFGNSYDIDKYKELQEAIAIFQNQRELYQKNFNINPCLIIQIPNSEKGEEELEHLKKLLNKEELNIKWMYMCDDLKKWDSNDKIKTIKQNQWKTKWKEIAKLMNSQIDVIIFKMVITEGWDIRRANMFFQIRNTDSETLTEQVIGRIRRNPILTNWENYNDEQHKIAMKAFVWGDVSDGDRVFKRVKSVEEPKIEIQTTVLKDLKKIYENKKFDLKTFLNNKNVTNVKTIFELHKEWNLIEDSTKKITWEYVKSYSDWIKFSNLIKEIDLENKSLFKDYKNSIELSSKETLPKETYFEILKLGPNNMQFGPSDIDTEKDNFAWKIISNADDIYFFFDSAAEREFADKLKRWGKKVWAKNFYPNSKISFEYINITAHKSFPDFILLDKKNKYHIFEVKSFNESANFNLDPHQYDEKVGALKEFYKELAQFVDYIFYIPIKYTNVWRIYKYKKDNEEELITIEELEKEFKS